MIQTDWQQWCKHLAPQRDELVKAQNKAYKLYGTLGMVRVMPDLTKEIGIQHLPGTFTKVDSHTDVKILQVLSSGSTWEEAFKKLGEQW